MFESMEKQFQQIDYDLKVREIDKTLGVELLKTKDVFGDDVVLYEDIRFPQDDTNFPLVAITEKGVFVFYKSYQEITDLNLHEQVSLYYDKFLASVEGLEGGNFVFYLLLNTPISQKAFYGLYNPNMEFMTPIQNLAESIQAELNCRTKQFNKDSFSLLISQFDNFGAPNKGPLETDKYYEDHTGRYIKKRGEWKRLSEVNPETYFSLLLFGGIFGIHKAYIKKIGAFLVYFFTLGFCGVGWFFDMIEVFCGIARDRNKLYIGPFTNKRKKTIMFLIGILAVTFFLAGVGFLIMSLGV